MNILMNRCFLMVILAILLCGSVIAVAQNGGQSGSKPDTDLMIEGWRAELDQISSAIKREGVSDDELVSFRDRTQIIAAEAKAFAENATPLIESLETKLSKLTPSSATPPVTPPATTVTNGSEQSEDSPQIPTEAADLLTKEDQLADRPDTGQNAPSNAERALLEDKAVLEAMLSAQKAHFGRTQVIIVRSDELLLEINQLRREKFTALLLSQSPSIINPSLWITGLKEFPWLIKGFTTIISSGVKRAISDAPFVLAGTIIFGLVISIFIFRKLSPVTGPSDRALPRAFHEKNAIRLIFRQLAIVTLTPAIVLITLEEIGALSRGLSVLAWDVFEGVFYYTLALTLAYSVLSPRSAERRLAEVSDQQARAIYRTISLCLAIALGGFVVLDLAEAIVISVDTVGLIYSVLTIAFTLTAFLTALSYQRLNKEKMISLPDVLVFRIIGIFFVISLIIAFAAPFIGYALLGAFFVAQMVLSGIIAGLLLVFFRILDAYCVSSTGAVTHQSGTPPETRPYNQRTIQVLLLTSGAAKITLILMGVLIVAASWGLDTAGIWGDLAKLFEEIKIGEFTLSPSTVLTALFIFCIGIIFIRSLQRWFATKFLPTTSLDTGLQNSIATGIGYLGFTIVAMIAFSQAGLDLSNLAIVAGALSLGIGFGLQSIVSNFVSGIILLAERPIKAGDWIEVGGEQGTVRKISVRSTEIETFDRATVIVPNADFISGSVKNMMYGDTIGRFAIAIGVDYGSDPDQVQEILLKCASDHPMVLAYPEAYVIFADFGASSLDFELRGYIADCNNVLTVKSDLRFEMLRRFRSEGIDIPFPQRDLNVKGLDHLGLPSSFTLSDNETDNLAIKTRPERSLTKGRSDEPDAE